MNSDSTENIVKLKLIYVNVKKFVKSIIEIFRGIIAFSKKCELFSRIIFPFSSETFSSFCHFTVMSIDFTYSALSNMRTVMNKRTGVPFSKIKYK